MRALALVLVLACLPAHAEPMTLSEADQVALARSIKACQLELETERARIPVLPVVVVGVAGVALGIVAGVVLAPYLAKK